MLPSLPLAVALVGRLWIGALALGGAAAAGAALVLAVHRSYRSAPPALRLGAVLPCAGVLALAVARVAPLWAIVVAAVGLLWALQALALSVCGPELDEYADADTHADGSPGWWAEFERSFWRHVARRDRDAP